MVSLFACMNVGVEVLHAFPSSCECLSCQLSVAQKLTVNVDGVLYTACTLIHLMLQLSLFHQCWSMFYFNCPLHFEPPYCEM